MLSWKDYYVQEQVRQDRLREAQQERMVSQLRQDLREARKKVSSQLLESLGCQLVGWGKALLRRVERSLAS